MKKGIKERLKRRLGRVGGFGASIIKAVRIDRVLIQWLAAGIVIGLAGSTLLWVRSYNRKIENMIRFDASTGGDIVSKAGDYGIDIKVGTGKEESEAAADTSPFFVTGQGGERIEAEGPAGTVAQIEAERPAEAEERKASEDERKYSPVDERLLFPLNGEIKRGFGWYKDETAREWRFNPGIDISSDKNRDVVAALSGKVKNIRYDSRYGSVIEIEHYGGLTTVYGNTESGTLSVGEFIPRGARIGGVGVPGASASTIHFEIRRDGEPIDPISFASR